MTTWSPAEREALIRRKLGYERQGQVSIRDFDQGVVETMGAFVEGNHYWLNVGGSKPSNVDGIDPAPGKPGIMVTFSFPEAEFSAMVLPMILVRREEISPALHRWQGPGCLKYTTMAKEGLIKQFPQVMPPGQTALSGMSGPDLVEEAQQAWPFDFMYTISILARYRGAPGQRGQVHQILRHVLGIYNPYGFVIVHDDIGDQRTYEAFMEGTSVMDEHPEVADRVIGFGVTLRIEGELDLFAPEVRPTVTQPLTLNLKPL